MTFDERLKARAQAEDVPLPPGFQERLETKLNEITEKEGRPVKKRIFRTALLAAAVCAALTVTALAASPTLRQALAAALGSFEPYSRAVEGISVTDQNIRVKLVNTLCDESGGVAYLQVTDLGKEPRLDGNTFAGGVGLPSAYDSETATALYAVEIGKLIQTAKGLTVSNGPGWFETDGKGGYTGAVELAELRPGVVYLEDVSVPWDLLKRDRLQSRPLTEDEKKTMIEELDREPAGEVLLPEQTPAALEGTDLVSLSSMGYDQNGVFHIQLKFADGVRPDEDDFDVCPVIDYFPSRINGVSIQTARLDGGRYLDITMQELTDDLHGQFCVSSIDGKVRTKPVIEGSWKLTFPLEMLPERTVKLNEDSFDSIVLEQVSLSVRSAKFDFKYVDPSQPTIPGWPVSIYLTDGTCVDLGFYEFTFVSRYLGEDGNERTVYKGARFADVKGHLGCSVLWPYPKAIDPEDVAAVSIGLRYIPLDGSEGSWLSELPQAAE